MLACVTAVKAEIFLLDSLSLQILRQIKVNHDLPCTVLLFSPDDKLLFSASADCSVFFTRVAEDKSAGPLTLLFFQALFALCLVAVVLLSSPTSPLSIGSDREL